MKNQHETDDALLNGIRVIIDYQDEGLNMASGDIDWIDSRIIFFDSRHDVRWARNVL
jgi:hypothetical protein